MAIAQNNAIFKGGNADGWVSKNSLQTSNNIYKGGIADGYATLNYAQLSTNIFKGGISDGWSSLNYLQLSTNIFKGGFGDGWDGKNYIQASAGVTKGGIGDGWSYKNYIQSSLIIAKGGFGDGWASTYRPQGPLPITLLSFDARKLNAASAILNWATSQEINTAFFEVERSPDAINYGSIGHVLAAGNSSTSIQYSFTDLMPLTGMNYYRLRQVDRDGRFIYTPSRLVKFDGSPATVQYYPNPTHGLLSIRITSQMMSEPMVVNISTASGIVVAQMKTNTNSSNILNIDMSNFAKGTYFIQVKTASTNSTQRIVLQ